MQSKSRSKRRISKRLKIINLGILIQTFLGHKRTFGHFTFLSLFPPTFGQFGVTDKYLDTQLISF